MLLVLQGAISDPALLVNEHRLGQGMAGLALIEPGLATYLEGYLEVIRESDIVLIANFEKSGVPGYVGPNTLVEVAFARALGKPAVFLHHPGLQPCRLEALAMMATCLDGDPAKLMQS